MYDAEFAVLMVIALGLVVGGGSGLLIGYIARIQAPGWAGMCLRNKIISLLLVIVFSAATIAALSFEFLVP